jgi:hypothetical protein
MLIAAGTRATDYVDAAALPELKTAIRDGSTKAAVAASRDLPEMTAPGGLAWTEWVERDHRATDADLRSREASLQFDDAINIQYVRHDRVAERRNSRTTTS